MSYRIITLALSAILLAGCGGGSSSDQATTKTPEPIISGRIEAGLRVLTIDPGVTEAVQFTIYRGDYVRLEATPGEPITINIPDLKVSKTFPVAQDEKPYFKVPDSGRFAFVAGPVAGVINAIDFVATGYRELTAKEGAALIASTGPYILDVRTQAEFSQGHLPDAHLMPVQVLRTRLDELAALKNSSVFVYCRSGNRSTVAAKMLMDNGFTSVANLRGGIGTWVQAGLPIVK